MALHVTLDLYARASGQVVKNRPRGWIHAEPYINYYLSLVSIYHHGMWGALSVWSVKMIEKLIVQSNLDYPNIDYLNLSVIRTPTCGPVSAM